MKYLKFLILLLILSNLSGYLLIHHNDILGTALYIIEFSFITIYYFLSKKENPNIHFVVFGILFFLISLVINNQFSESFLITFAKYFIFIALMSSILRDVKDDEIYGILMICALSIICEAIFINGIGSRNSGFYLNSNLAAFVCAVGYIYGSTMYKKNLKIVGQFVFTIAGLTTFSVIFLVIWGLINFQPLFSKRKNTYKFAVCMASFIAFISFNDQMHLNTKQVAVDSIKSSNFDKESKFENLKETWTLYYDKVLKNPLFGNGYGKTAGEEDIRFTIQISVHNIFLMIIGEAGIFALLYFLCIYGYLILKGIYFFKQNPSVFFISLALVLYMLTTHSYFDNYLILFTSLRLYQEIYKLKELGCHNQRVIIRSNRNVNDPTERDLLKQYRLN
ncbi:hypothetical protein ABDJ41_06180 [Pedobacter sp. ASV1-7]|uniref:O-antigen ligase family protein n=1 Tax=Pedobacter sp. ASV1-7 TaxID=3145237 RepID=UPI0032E85B4D